MNKLIWFYNRGIIAVNKRLNGHEFKGYINKIPFILFRGEMIRSLS